MTKQKAILIEGIIFVVTIFTVYSGISVGIGGNFKLSVNNTEYALFRGFVLGIFLVSITLPLLLKKTKAVQLTGLIIGVGTQILLFFAFVIYTSIGVSV